MKGIRLAAGILCLLCLLTACEETIPGQDETLSPSALTVHVETKTMTACADDGTILASCRYCLPEISGGKESPAAETFNKEFREWADAADFSALETAARLEYIRRRDQGIPWDCPYYQNLECNVYQNSRLVSVAGCLDYFDGGGHPKTIPLGWNFDLDAGTFVTPESLFDDAGQIAAELIRQASERVGMPDADYEKILSLWSDSAAAVTFDADEMTVAYSPYDLSASDAAGAQIFTISRTRLEPYLNAYGKSLWA